MIDLRLGIAAASLKAVLIVDAADVTHDALAIENEDLRIARRGQLVGQLIVQILEQWKRDTVHLGELSHLGQRVLAIGVDAKERHAFAFVFLGEFGEPRAIQFAQRTLDAEEGDDDELRLFQLRERVRLAAKVLQREFFDLLADRRRRFLSG